MKLLHILTILLIMLLISSSTAQIRRGNERCAGRPRNPSCSGGRNQGRRGATCRARTMIYYDAESGQCRQMRYRGCGGNNNRWCSVAHCRRRCIP